MCTECHYQAAPTKSLSGALPDHPNETIDMPNDCGMKEGMKKKKEREGGLPLRKACLSPSEMHEKLSENVG